MNLISNPFLWGVWRFSGTLHLQLGVKHHLGFIQWINVV